VELTPANCWDCPAPLVVILAYYTVFAAALILAGRLHRSQRESYRTSGWIIATLTFLFAAAITHVVPNWGISKSWDRLVPWFSQRETRVILLALDAALIVILLVARGRRVP